MAPWGFVVIVGEVMVTTVVMALCRWLLLALPDGLWLAVIPHRSRPGCRIRVALLHVVPGQHLLQCSALLS